MAKTSFQLNLRRFWKKPRCAEEETRTPVEIFLLALYFLVCRTIQLSAVGFELYILDLEVQREKNIALEVNFALLLKKRIFPSQHINFLWKDVFVIVYFYSTKSDYNYSTNDFSIWNALRWAEEQNAIKTAMATMHSELIGGVFPFPYYSFFSTELLSNYKEIMSLWV